MLEKLLFEIRKGGTLQPAALAARLNTSIALVEMMLEDLERRGILTQYRDSCDSSACGGCSLGGTCAGPANPKNRVWILR
jgi:hypothetical protein